MYIQSLYVKKTSILFLSAALVLTASLFSAEKTFAIAIRSNESVTITWTSFGVGASSCLATNSYNLATWTGQKSSNGTFSTTIPAYTFPAVTATYTFEFSCLSDVNSSSAGARISSGPIAIEVFQPAEVGLVFSDVGSSNPLDIPPTMSSPLTSSKTSLLKSSPTDSMVLSWNYSDQAGVCTASGSTVNDTTNNFIRASWSGIKATVGTERIYNTNNLTDTYTRNTYTLTCQSPNRAAVVSTTPFDVYMEGKPDTGACFIAGTKVLMADGSKKNVEDVTLDDHLMTSGGPQEVMKTYRIAHEGKLYAFNNSGNYFVSGTHPFMTTEGWKSVNPEGTRRESPGIQVSALRVGDNLVLHGGRYMTLTALDSISTSTTVYNFGINGTHDYYADDYLVHNVSIKDIFQKAYASLCKTC